MILTVDPGVVTCGWAEWSDSGILTAAGSLVLSKKDKKGGPFDCVRQLVCALPLDRAHRAYVEWPTIRFGSAKGAAAAEDVLMIVYMIGYLGGKLGGVNLHTVPVTQWKGCLPKDVCHRRIKKILGRIADDYDQHALDAIGIGLWVFGRF